MCKYYQKGFTLIELLVCIVLLTIICTILWNVFFQGIKYSDIATTKNQMQQEANIIITKMKEIHLTSEKYSIVSNDGIITVNYVDKKGVSQNVVFENSHLLLSTVSKIDQKPKVSDTKFNLVIEDKKSGRTYTASTLLYRLKGGNSE